jgi:hypothetical protein
MKLILAVAVAVLVAFTPRLPATHALARAAAVADAPPSTEAKPVPEARDSHAEIAPDDDYLSAASRLTLRFRGYPELTGDYRVSADRVISIPVIGRVSIAGLKLPDLEKTLSSRLSQIVQKEAFVSAEIAAYLPVYVTGAVRNPGAVEWRPGLSVLQAIALVGGMAAEVVPGGTPLAGSNPLLLEKAVDEQKRNLAVLARLHAERKSLTEVPVPTQLVSLVGAAEAESLIAKQREILHNELGAQTSKLDILQEGIDAGQSEMSSLKAQLAELDTQLQLRQDYRARVRTLIAKGISTAERELEEGIKVTDLEEKITNIRVAMAKSAETVAQLRLSADGVRRDRVAVIDAELNRIEGQSAQLDLEISAMRQLPRDLPKTAKDASAEDPKSPFQIVRRRNGGSVTIDAERSTLMQPGDVLIVARS